MVLFTLLSRQNRGIALITPVLIKVKPLCIAMFSSFIYDTDILGKKNLVIRNVQISDDGMYSCQFSGQNEKLNSIAARLNVIGKIFNLFV